MSKTFHYSTFGVGSSFRCAGWESNASHVESGHIPPGTSAQQGGLPSSLPMVASAPLEQIHSLAMALLQMQQQQKENVIGQNAI